MVHDSLNDHAGTIPATPSAVDLELYRSLLLARRMAEKIRQLWTDGEVHEGTPTIRPRMEMTLSCDHRILYGADAAEFLGAIRDGLRRPTRLLL